MSLLELFDGWSNAAEDWTEHPVVDDFGAHHGSQRYLEPDKKEEFQRVIEWDDI